MRLWAARLPCGKPEIHELGDRRDADLVHQVAAVDIDGLAADAQAPGDLLAFLAVDHEAQDFGFPRRDIAESPSQPEGRLFPGKLDRARGDGALDSLEQHLALERLWD